MSALGKRRLATEAAEHVGATRKKLRARMNAMGLTEVKGWVMVERIVDRPGGGATWTFAPMHAKDNPPAGVECAVTIDAEGKIDPGG
jgi:hypothetical protein